MKQMLTYFDQNLFHFGISKTACRDNRLIKAHELSLKGQAKAHSVS